MDELKVWVCDIRDRVWDWNPDWDGDGDWNRAEQGQGVEEEEEEGEEKNVKVGESVFTDNHSSE